MRPFSPPRLLRACLTMLAAGLLFTAALAAAEPAPAPAPAATPPTPAMPPATVPTFSLPADFPPAQLAGEKWFAAKLEADLNAGQTDILNQAFDPAAFWDRAMHGLTLAPAARTKGLQFLREKTRPAEAVAGTIVAARSKVKFVALTGPAADRRLLLRLTSLQSEISYLELRLHLSADGRRLIVDDFIPWNNGQSVVQALRLSYLTQESARDPAHPPLPPAAAALADHAETVTLFMDPARGDAATLRQAWLALPPALRADRDLAFAFLGRALKLQLPEAAQLVEDFARDESALGPSQLMAYNQAMADKRYADAVRYADRLVRGGLGDAGGLVLLAKAEFRAGQFDLARRHTAAAVKLEPAWPEGYMLAVFVCLQAKDFPAALQLMTAFETNTGLQLGDLPSIPMFKEFVQSDQYPAWQAAHPTVPPEPTPAPAQP